MGDSKSSKLRPPSKIGRPCCTVPPKPALPPSPPRSTMNSMDRLWESHGRRLSEAGLRRGSDTSVILTDDTDSFIIGDRVWVGGTKPGCIAYIGETQFAPGDWAGIVLDDPIGKNDGSVAGSRYFQCESKRGIFSRLTRLTRQPLTESTMTSPSGEKTPTSPSDNSRFNLDKSVSPSLNASTTSLASVSHKDLKLGDRVIVSSSQGSKTGVLRYIGQTEFAAGEWCGVELDDAIGKNDGSVGEIRYFECRPMHGLFAPSHKVSRSPSSRRTSAMCAIHRPTGMSMNSSVRRIGGSRESLASMSSVASTNASVATRGTTSGSRRPGLRTSTPARSSMQEMLKEKQQEIEMLRKERDFERNRISKAATQANNAEQTAMTIKQEYDKYRQDMEQTVREAHMSLAKLLEEKNSLKAHLEEERQKSEDLLFRFEEESVNKDDIQNQSGDEIVANTINQSRLQELERQLTEERERVIQLENENTKLFEAEEEIVKLRTELSMALSHEQENVQDIQNRSLCLEEAKITLENQMLERNDLIEQYANRIKELETKFSQLDEENSTRKNHETNLLQTSDETNRNLLEKIALVETMKNERETESKNYEKEIERLKEIIETTTSKIAESEKLLNDEHRRIIDETENTMKTRLENFAEETKRHEETHRNALEKLRDENVDRINSLSENFKKQLDEKDSEIISMSNRLEERGLEIEKLVKDLSELRAVCVVKDDEMKQMLERYEELSENYKSMEKANEELKKEIDELRLRNEETCSSFSREKQKLEDSVANLLMTSDESCEKLKKLNDDLKMKEKELSELRDEKMAEIEKLRSLFECQIEDKTKFITEMRAEVTEKNVRLGVLEKEIANLNSIIANKDEEIKNLLEKTTEMRDAITLSEQTKTNLESELKMYDVNIAELNVKLSRAEEKCNQLVEQKFKLEAEVANVISTSSNSSDQLMKYSEDLRTKEKELYDTQERSFELQNSLSTVESKLVTTLEQLSEIKNLNEKLQKESNERMNELMENKKTNDELLLKIKNLNDQEQTLLESLKSKEKLDEDVKSKILEILQLQENVESKEKIINDLNEKYSSLKNENLEEEKKLIGVSENLKMEIARLNKEFSESRGICETLKTERKNMEETMEVLKNNLNLEMSEKKKLEIEITRINEDGERFSTMIETLKVERDEAKMSAQSSNEKYNETLTKLALLNSSLANTETESSLELTNLREQLSRVENNCKEFTERLEERENFVGQLNVKLSTNLEILKSKEMENLKLSTSLKNVESQVEELTKISKVRETELNDELKNRETKNLELESKLAKLQLEFDEGTKMTNQAEEKTVMLEKKIEESENICRTKKNEIDSVKKIAEQFEEENKNLQALIVTLRDDLSVRNNICQDMTLEIENLRGIRENAELNEKRDNETKLEAQKNKIVELNRENENLRMTKETMEMELNTEREKIESLSNLLQETELSTSKNMRNLEDKLSQEATAVGILKENQNRLEKENKQILEKLNQAMENLKTHNENKKNNHENESYPINQTIQSAGGDMNQNSDGNEELKKMSEENEMHKGQIEFLNSVIVDMQRKNETLLCKIEVLEMGVPANEADDYNRTTLDKRMAAPRMFCDICDQFDLHETEDCPRQAQDFDDQQKPKKSPKKPTIERPYCEICEKFGHDTINCDDTETF